MTVASSESLHFGTTHAVTQRLAFFDHVLAGNPFFVSLSVKCRAISFVSSIARLVCSRTLVSCSLRRSSLRANSLPTLFICAGVLCVPTRALNADWRILFTLLLRILFRVVLAHLSVARLRSISFAGTVFCCGLRAPFCCELGACF